MLLEGALKEDFHFTPYSTISYLVLGPRANALKTGRLLLSIKHLSTTKATPGNSSVTSMASCKSHPKNKPLFNSASAVGTARYFIEADKMATTNPQQPATDGVAVKHRKKQLFTGYLKKGINFDSSSDDSDSAAFQVSTIKRPNKNSTIIIVDSD